jgi:hypothetical protein
MNSSNLIGRKLQIGSKAFRRRSKTNKRQTEAEPTWHLFWTENFKKTAKRRAPVLEKQKSG